MASTIGVLLTRGQATEIYPENVLTFQTLEPVTICTERSAQAFQPVQQGDYAPNSQAQLRPGARPNKRAYPFFSLLLRFSPTFRVITATRLELIMVTCREVITAMRLDMATISIAL